MEQKKKEKIAEHLRTIAEQEGITESEVRNEIAYAVALALKSNNPKIQNFWKNIPCEGSDSLSYRGQESAGQKKAVYGRGQPVFSWETVYTG